MAITRSAHLVSAHLWFFPSGVAFTVPAAASADASNRPGHEPAIPMPLTAAAIDAGWIDLGAVESLKISSKAGAEVKIYGAAASSGVKSIKKILRGMIERTFSAMLSDWSPFALGLFFRAAIPVDSGTNTEIPAMTPDSQASQDGWLYFEGYDASTASSRLVRGYIWGNAEIAGDGETDTTKNWGFTVNHIQQLSTLNTILGMNA